MVLFYRYVCCSVLRCVEKFTMTGTRSSSGVIPQVCVLRCVAVCCDVLQLVKTCTMTGTHPPPGVIPQVCVLRVVVVALCCTAWKRVRWLVLCCTALHCVALVALRKNVYDIWYPLFAWCDSTGVCCTVLHCVKMYYDDWDSLFAWCDPTGMCVALFCTVWKRSRWLGPALRLVWSHRYVCCGLLLLHCVALRENLYDNWYCVALCCTGCTASKRLRYLVPALCVVWFHRYVCCGVLQCVVLCSKVYDDWYPLFVWCYTTGMCVAVCCTVWKRCRWLEINLRVGLCYSHVCCTVLRCVAVLCNLWKRLRCLRWLLQIKGLFCKRALQQRLYSAKETYDLKEPTNRSHPISNWICKDMNIYLYICMNICACIRQQMCTWMYTYMYIYIYIYIYMYINLCMNMCLCK